MSPTREALFVEIGELIKQHSEQSDIEFEDGIRIDDLGVDSIDLLEIVFRLEEAHGVAINPRGLQGRRTFGDIVDYAFETIAS